MVHYSSNLSKLMEAETISKNGASLKSHTSKGLLLPKAVFSVISLILIALSLSVLNSCANSGGNASNSGDANSYLIAGTWLREEGQTKIPGDRLELLSDGKCISGGYGFTWKTENDRLHLTGPLGIAWSYDYKISGSTLTLSDKDGSRATYVKKQR